MQYFTACRKIVYLKTGIDEREYSAEVYKRKEKLELYEQLKKSGCPSCAALKAISVSKATYSRWKSRYKKHGLAGLESGSRAPNNVRLPEWSESLEAAVLLIRHQHPLYGKSKIAVLLKRECMIKTSVSTVGRILKKLVTQQRVLPASYYYGRTKIKRKRVFNKHAQRWTYGMKAERPGQLIQIDHLVVSVESGRPIRHFTATCPITRLTVDQVYSRANSRAALDFLDYAQKEFPFKIESIQVDGGSEFRGEFEHGCQERGIKLHVLPPRSPQYNGKVERRNGTARYEFYALYDGQLAVEEVRRHLRPFMNRYNRFRPHQALQYQTPWQYYQMLGT